MVTHTGTAALSESACREDLQESDLGFISRFRFRGHYHFYLIREAKIYLSFLKLRGFLAFPFLMECYQNPKRQYFLRYTSISRKYLYTLTLHILQRAQDFPFGTTNPSFNLIPVMANRKQLLMPIPNEPFHFFLLYDILPS